MNSSVVVDGSLAFKWLVEEEHSSHAHALLKSWERQEVRLVAPYLLPFEVANALHRRVVRGELSAGGAGDLIGSLLSSRLELHQSAFLHARALELASQLNLGAAYDAHYLALAEQFDCEFWTADQKFYRAAGSSVNNVRWIGEFSEVE